MPLPNSMAPLSIPMEGRSRSVMPIMLDLFLAGLRALSAKSVFLQPRTSIAEVSWVLNIVAQPSTHQRKLATPHKPHSLISQEYATTFKFTHQLLLRKFCSMQTRGLLVLFSVLLEFNTPFRLEKRSSWVLERFSRHRCWWSLVLVHQANSRPTGSKSSKIYRALGKECKVRSIAVLKSLASHSPEHLDHVFFGPSYRVKTQTFTRLANDLLYVLVQAVGP